MVTDYAETIKRSVTMRDVAEYYGFTLDRRSSKICCPFHQDSHPSMHIYPGEGGFHCFVCGANGDVIGFVQKLFNLGFIDACKKMDEDFHLGLNIGAERTAEERKEAERAYAKRMEQKLAWEKKHTELVLLYDIAYNRYALLDRMKAEFAPANRTCQPDSEYVYACAHIDEAWYEVETTQESLRKLEKDRT